MAKHLLLATALIALPLRALPAAAPAVVAKPTAKAPAPEAAKPEAPAAAQEPGASTRAESTFAHLRAPLFSEDFGETPVAKVAGSVVTLGELREALAAAHEDAHGAAGKQDFAAILDRLVQVRLFIAEGHDMGLDELEEIKKDVERFRESELREALKREATAGLKPDPAEVEPLVKQVVREWKLRSVLFEKEEDAKGLADAVKAGKPFDELANQAIADKKADGAPAGQFFSRKAVLPEVLAVLEKLEPGAVSPPVKLKQGFTVLRLEEVRYPDDPEERARAEEAVLEKDRRVALRKFYEELVKKHAKIDRALLKRLDFHQKKKFEALTKDQRPLVRIAGEKPLTVADLTAEVAKDFFHGVDAPARDQKINYKKETKLEIVLARRLYTKEARERGLHLAPAYKQAVKRYGDSLVFGAFVQRVVLPEVDVKESDLRAYYDQHQAEYSYPQFYKLDSVAFAAAKDAEAALEKLRKGTDFEWLKANAERQLPEEQRTVHLDGGTMTARGLPEPIAKALSGTKAGDYRVYAAPEGDAYVIRVLDETPPQPQPYPEAREAIAPKIFREKFDKALADWTAKLRAHHDVKVYVTRLGE